MPLLVRNRSLFAFRNGLYDAKRDTFREWDSPNLANMPQYACAFHDIDFDYNPDANGRWEDVAQWGPLIDTSSVDGIFSKQFGADATEEFKMKEDDYLSFLHQVCLCLCFVSLFTPHFLNFVWYA